MKHLGSVTLMGPHRIRVYNQNYTVDQPVEFLFFFADNNVESWPAFAA